MKAGTVQFRKIRSIEIMINGSPSLGPNEAWTPSAERDTHNLPGQLDAFSLSLGTRGIIEGFTVMCSNRDASSYGRAAEARMLP